MKVFRGARGPSVLSMSRHVVEFTGAEGCDRGRGSTRNQAPDWRLRIRLIVDSLFGDSFLCGWT